MTRLLISAAFAGLLALGGGSAWAQGQDDHRDRGGRDQQAPQAAPAPREGGGRNQQAPQAAPAPHQAAPAPRQGGGAANTPRGSSSGGFMNFGNAARGAAPAAAPANTARGSDQNRQGRAMNNSAPAPNTDMRGPSSNNDRRGLSSNNAAPNNDRRGQAGNNRGGPAPNRDFSAYHRNFNAPRRFRAQTYQRPQGWYAHRWTYGEILPSMFWAQNYWLNDYVDFDLPPPPPGTVWVRDGQDALLIDRFSGEIIEVDYSVFY